MRAIEIPSTNKTPHVLIHIDAGIVTLKGRSIPEVPTDFYKPLIDALDEYKIKIPNKVIVMEFDMEYFNTASAKVFMDMFKRMQGTKLEIVWIYEEGDDDILEAGEDYKSMMSGFIPVKILKKPKK